MHEPFERTVCRIADRIGRFLPAESTSSRCIGQELPRDRISRIVRIDQRRERRTHPNRKSLCDARRHRFGVLRNEPCSASSSALRKGRLWPVLVGHSGEPLSATGVQITCSI